MNLQKIFPSNTFEELVDKINKNFDEIVLNGGGPMGPAGPSGIGIPGGPGIQGVQGIPGQNGSNWTISGSNPTVAPVVPNFIYWLNYNSTELFSWNGSTWNSIGSFGSTNYFYNNGSNVISNKVHNDTLVLSDETGSPYNTANNPLNFLLKLNSTNGNHLLFTDVDSNDNNGTTFQLDSNAFNINQNDPNLSFNINNAGQFNIISDGIRINSLTSAGTHILSKVGISTSGTQFTPNHTLQIGNSNGTDTGELSIEKNSKILFKGTGIGNTIELQNTNSNDGGIQKLAKGNGVLSILKDFNINSFSEDYIEWRLENKWAWCPNTSGVYSYNTQLDPNISHIIPIMSVGAIGTTSKLFETSANTNIGMYSDVFFKWKIINNQVHVIWSVSLKFFYRGTGGYTRETLTGLRIKLPYNIASNVSLKANSKYRIDNNNPNYWSKKPNNIEVHNGSIMKQNKVNSMVYQFIDWRDVSGNFEQTYLEIIDCEPSIINFNVDGNAYNNYILSGECFLDIAQDSININNWNIFNTLVTYNGGILTKSNNTIPYGSIIYWVPTNNDQYFSSNGLGVRGDVVGWAICDGRNGTVDMRQKVPFGAEQISNNPGIITVLQSGLSTPNAILGTSYTDNAILGPGVGTAPDSSVTLNGISYFSSTIFDTGGTNQRNIAFRAGVFLQKII